VDGGGALVLPARAAARIRLQLLAARLLAARQRHGVTRQQRLRREPDGDLARLRLPLRSLILVAFLIPQAFPNLPVYVNIARLFYGLGLNGTIPGVVLVHVTHGLVYAVWIATAAFSAIDRELEEAARSIGASALRTFRDVTLPLAAPGLMASAIFVFLESLDEFTGSFFVGAPDVNLLPLLLYTAGAGGNYQIASITALLLLVPSIGFMLVVERFLKADVLSRVGH
jgi:putative spermidine/putrescine transport system permease protein